MPNPTPLFIVAGTVAMLLLIQQLLARATKRHQLAVATATPPERPRGHPLVEGLNVVGLDERGVDSLRSLMKAGDIEALATFLAFNRPRIEELQTYLQRLYEQFHEAADAVPVSSFPPLPGSLSAEPLSATERNLLLSLDPRQQRHVDREFMAQFGGHAFLEHFELYCARETGVTLHVPPFDPVRGHFETLARSGVAAQGRQIPLQQRLSVLKMQELRQMAKDLKLTQKFTRKADAAEALSQVPGAAVLLSMQYVIDDLFMLKPLEVDPHAVQQEWGWLSAYAHLLASAPLRRTSLD